MPSMIVALGGRFERTVETELGLAAGTVFWGGKWETKRMLPVEDSNVTVLFWWTAVPSKRRTEWITVIPISDEDRPELVSD